jgi:NADPH-dependent 2,4-dienoyl-CoA reductase/sulfur reductase-like enzyme
MAVSVIGGGFTGLEIASSCREPGPLEHWEVHDAPTDDF